MLRTLGDFLDYSLSSKWILAEYTNCYSLLKNVFNISKLNEKVALLNFKFKLRTGIRPLLSKEIFRIWGFSTKVIILYVPTQPLSFILKSYLISR